MPQYENSICSLSNVLATASPATPLATIPLMPTTKEYLAPDHFRFGGLAPVFCRFSVFYSCRQTVNSTYNTHSATYSNKINQRYKPYESQNMAKLSDNEATPFPFAEDCYVLRKHLITLQTQLLLSSIIARQSIPYA